MKFSLKVSINICLAIIMSSTAASAGELAWKDTLEQGWGVHSQAVERLNRYRDNYQAACQTQQLNHCENITPPVKHPAGYGLLPEILANTPPAPVSTKTTEYSIERLSSWLKTTAERANALPSTANQQAIDEYISIRNELNNAQLHLKYHDYWQQAAIDHGEWFAQRRYLAEQAENLIKLKATGSELFPSVREDFAAALDKFKRAPNGIHCEVKGGEYLLNLELLSDITDEPYLQRFAEIIRQHFNGPSRFGKLKIELDIQTISPTRLYDGKPPEYGSSINEAEHLKRFADTALVLTSGSPSTHAFATRSVHLGPSPIAPRTLAHEFGHLLGFDDIYLRHFVAHSDARYGVVFTEWTGLSESLMGNSRGGEVTSAMRDTLIEQYCTAP